MAFNVGAAVIQLKLSGTAKVMRGFRAIGNAARKMGAVIKAGVAIGIVAFTALAAAGAAAIKIAVTQEDAETKLAAVLKATGNAAGFTAQQLFDEATALQMLTRFGDEAIINGQALIATFKNISGDEFKRATVAMLDMSTVMDQDLKSSAIQLGKALNDPIKGVASLSRVGVTFTKKQIDMIRVLQESNDLLGAQGVILEELEGQFKGAAKAAGDNFGGQVAKLKNLLGDLAEEAGFVLINELKKLTGGLEVTEERMEELKSTVRIVTKAIVDSIKIAVLVIAKLRLQVLEFFDDIPAAAEKAGRKAATAFADAVAGISTRSSIDLSGDRPFTFLSKLPPSAPGQSGRQTEIDKLGIQISRLVKEFGQDPGGRKRAAESVGQAGFNEFFPGIADLNSTLTKSIDANTEELKEEKKEKKKPGKEPKTQKFTPSFVGVDQLFRRIQMQFGAVDVPKQQLQVQKGILGELKKGNDREAARDREAQGAPGARNVGGVFV